MSWFKRNKEGISTQTKDKKEVPEGVWYKCPRCKKTVTTKEHNEHLNTCPECNYHERIASTQYFDMLFDNAEYVLFFDDLVPDDFLGFTDLRPYDVRLKETQQKTGLKDAMQVAAGEINGLPIVVAAMDFEFIGGSMGVVVGEKIARAVDLSIENKSPLLIISRSGGARMMESAFSLMQMARTAAKLSQLADARLPYISLMTDPTTGGVSASFAMLGDINLAEPDALIGFAGPRVIMETIRQTLPEGFQRAESVMEHGFLDRVVHRKELKALLAQLFKILMHQPVGDTTDK
jgi:acetyl-CoA carboxylase carboxyl transferase subunit beta